MERSILVMVYYITTGSWNSCGRGRGGSGGDGAAAKKQDKFFASGPAADKPRQ